MSSRCFRCRYLALGHGDKPYVVETPAGLLGVRKSALKAFTGLDAEIPRTEDERRLHQERLLADIATQRQRIIDLGRYAGRLEDEIGRCSWR